MTGTNLQAADYWTARLELLPHPEGGSYKEVFRSSQEVVRKSSTAIKQACTSIYYLLEGNDFSGFHRLASDEIWYFHKGVPLLIHIIDEQGVYTTKELSDALSGSLSVVIEAGLWFAAEIPSAQEFTLVSCAVAPGFDFTEFEMAKKDEVIELYPQHRDILSRLCRI
jgi:predicted cupin superfamily sugar epimerase